MLMGLLLLFDVVVKTVIADIGGRGFVPRPGRGLALGVVVGGANRGVLEGAGQRPAGDTQTGLKITVVAADAFDLGPTKKIHRTRRKPLDKSCGVVLLCS